MAARPGPLFLPDDVEVMGQLIRRLVSGRHYYLGTVPLLWMRVKIGFSAAPKLRTERLAFVDTGLRPWQGWVQCCQLVLCSHHSQRNRKAPAVAACAAGLRGICVALGAVISRYGVAQCRQRGVVPR